MASALAASLRRGGSKGVGTQLGRILWTQGGYGETVVRCDAVTFSTEARSSFPPSTNARLSPAPFDLRDLRNGMVEQFLSPHLMSAMERHAVELKGVRESFRQNEADCGSAQVQIALLTQRIKYMAVHMTANKKDKQSRRGLDGMLNQRRKLLKYLRRKDWDSYCQVITRLGLRDRVDLQT